MSKVSEPTVSQSASRPASAGAGSVASASVASVTSSKAQTKLKSAREEDNSYSALLQDEELETLVSKQQFDRLRKDTLDDAISEADSDEEQVIDIDDFAGRTSNCSNAEEDELSLLRADSPLIRLRTKEKEADRVAKDGDPWHVVTLRQEILGLATMFLPYNVYGGPGQVGETEPMLVPEAHLKLAQAYLEVGALPMCADHCKRALQAMPVGEDKKSSKFYKDINVQLGELQLMSKPPKPHAALKYMYLAAGTDDVEEIDDLGIKVLAAQCFTMIGSSKMREGMACKAELDRMEQSRVMLATQLQGLMEDGESRKGSKYIRAVEKLKVLKSQMGTEEEAMTKHLDAARIKLDLASEHLISVIQQESDRMRNKVEKYKRHPLLMMLSRQSAQLMFKMALLEGTAGDLSAQLLALGEIRSADADNPGCVPPALMASTLKEQGACLVAAGIASSDPETLEQNLDKATEAYEELQSIQHRRFEDGSPAQAMAEAETKKLLGNVLIAKRDWPGARDAYEEARDKYIEHLGENDIMVADLEHRLGELDVYTSAGSGQDGS